MPEPIRIVLLGGAGAMPFAGVGWQVLQYLEGFRRLGHEVFYLEDTQTWPYDPERDTVSDDPGPTVAYVARAMERIGLGDAWAYRDVVSEGQVFGTSEAHLRRVLQAADVLINLSGATVLRDEHMIVPVRIYLETDPVLPQIEVAQGRRFTIDLLAAHTHHFTYGENFGAADCGVPIERFEYRPTRPPVVMDWWRAQPASTDGSAFTTVSNWKQTAKDIEWQGELYTWSKDVVFIRYLDLPQRVEQPLELALALDDEPTIAMLQAAGWRVVPAAPMSKDLDAYRRYICSSAGEFSVAKEQNVRLRSGWFSDRTATYLAAGKPAVVQDTGFGASLPVGEGLFAFANIDDAVSALAAIAADYPRHSAAAQAIAHDHLRCELVLGRLLDEALG
jgi:hypothetical protein